MNNLIDLCTEWSDKREIFTESTTEAQIIKLEEEFTELKEAANDHDLKDALGDMLVVMNNIAIMENTTLKECLEQAYSEIKDRVGVMKGCLYVKGKLGFAIWDIKNDSCLSSVMSFESCNEQLSSYQDKYEDADIVQVIYLDDGEVRRWD